ncbi:unnamed protein product [Toxocara canis]|uniref:Transposase n=1 Tax=Toxocara canis TaxID=6265 RepID=A0A183VHN8_TOXCA|nr:unnamed protein product [Toxocara canis]
MHGLVVQRLSRLIYTQNVAGPTPAEINRVYSVCGRYVNIDGKHTWYRGVAVITHASHAGGRPSDPGRGQRSVLLMVKEYEYRTRRRSPVRSWPRSTECTPDGEGI